MNIPFEDLTVGAHVAVNPLDNQRHTMIHAGAGWVYACQLSYWWLKCACEDDEGCVSP